MKFFALSIIVCALLLSEGKHSPVLITNELFLKNFQIPYNLPLKLDDSQYYFTISIHCQDWETAITTCREIGPNWDLLAIDSQDKAQAVLEFLKYEGVTNAEFWMGGKYASGAATKFVWGNGSPVPPWAPFEKPLPPPGPTDRVTYYMQTSGNPYWSRKKSTGHSRQSICEFVSTDVPVICNSENDLMVVLDSSGSIGAANYQIALTFVAKLLAAFKVSPENRVGFTLFANNVENIFTFSENLDANEIYNKVMAAPYRAGGTETEKALEEVFQQFSADIRAVPRNAILITDGHSARYNETIAAAQKVKSLGLRMFSVGVGDINPDELVAMAGDNNDHVFTTTEFAELLHLLNPVSGRVCRTIPN